MTDRFNQLEQFYFFNSRWLYDRFLQLIIYPSIWVAAAIASLGIYTQTRLNLGHNWLPTALIFVTALIPYNLDRIFDSYVQKIPEHKAQLFFRQPCIWVLLASAIATTIVLISIAPARVRYVCIAGIVPLLYGTPIFPWKQNSQQQARWRWYRLKDIPGSKAWIVGGTLTYAVIALPMAYEGARFDLTAAWLTLFMFVFIVTNSHIFDIRDIDSDRQKGVVTLPTIAGVRGTKVILTAMNLLVMLLAICLWIANLVSYRPEVVLALTINLIYIWTIKIDTPRWIYSILIEAFLFVPMLGNLALKAIGYGE